MEAVPGDHGVEWDGRRRWWGRMAGREAWGRATGIGRIWMGGDSGGGGESVGSENGCRKRWIGCRWDLVGAFALCDVLETRGFV